MKIKLLLITIVALATLASCNRQNKKVEHIGSKEVVRQDTFKTSLRPHELVGLGKVYTDTVQFTRFDDNGDYGLLFARKNKDTISLIYEQEYDFIRGDEIAINWKIDSLRPTGDSEYLSFTEFLVSAKLLKPLALKNKKVKFLWRETKYSEQYETDINFMILNEAYINTISAPEKAALAYVATFIGNECGWDGKANDDRSNLKCKILTALNLGYQCSQTHLGLLRQWFRNDKDALKTLERCPTTPDGATIQDTFDEITLEVKDGQIIVFSKITAINVREGQSASWTQTDYFEWSRNELKLIDEKRSEIERSAFDVNGN